MKRAALALLFAGRAAWADGAVDVAVRLEGGSELDSNASRESSTDGSLAHDPAAVGRGAGRVELSWRIARRQSFRMNALIAGKKYTGVTSNEQPPPSGEDIAVIASDARWDLGLGARPVAIGLRASYYDALEKTGVPATDRSIDHDFRTGDGAAVLALRAPHDQTATLTAGWRAFEFKSGARYSFHGEHVGLSYRRSFQPKDPGPTWDMVVDYTAHHRLYDGLAYVNTCPAGQPLGATCIADASYARADLMHVAAVELGYTGNVIASLRYELAVDASNSFGQSFVRHRIEADFTAELPWQSIFFSARGVLQLSQFLDPVLLTRDIGSTFTIEEENRNALIAHLTRDFGPHWAIELKLAFYANEFATQELQFRRLTAYLGAIYTWDSRE